MDKDITFKTAVSLKGHDEGRRYVVVKTVGADFVLVADGRYRLLDNPKLKRVKHLRVCGDSGLTEEGLTNEKVKKVLKDQSSGGELCRRKTT